MWLAAEVLYISLGSCKLILWRWGKNGATLFPTAISVANVQIMVDIVSLVPPALTIVDSSIVDSLDSRRICISWLVT